MKGEELLEKKFSEMQEAIENAVMAEHTPDKVLAKLIEIVSLSIVENRPVFGVMEEPVLFRMFRQWVKESVELVRELHKGHSEALDNATNM